MMTIETIIERDQPDFGPGNPSPQAPLPAVGTMFPWGCWHKRRLLCGAGT